MVLDRTEVRSAPVPAKMRYCIRRVVRDKSGSWKCSSVHQRHPSGYHSDVPLETSTNGLHGSPGLLQCLRDTYNVVVHGNCSNSAMAYTGAPSISHLARGKMTVYLSHSPLRDLSPPRLPQNSIPLLELDGSHFCRGLFGSALKPHGLGGVARPPPELLLPRN